MAERNGTASAHRRLPAAALPLDEPVTGPSCNSESIPPDALLGKVLERTNLQRALKQVRQNKGAPGVDGMTVDALPGYLRKRRKRGQSPLIAERKSRLEKWALTLFPDPFP